MRLPLKVRGRDAHGFAFEEETSSENLCRNGTAFVTRFDVEVGCDLEIRITMAQHAPRRPAQEHFAGPGYRFGGPSSNGNRFNLSGSRFNDSDFSTSGRVVHVADTPSGKTKLVGVQFTGPRFQRMFRSESVAEAAPVPVPAGR